MFDLYNTLESYNMIDNNEYAYEGIGDKIKKAGSTIWGLLKKIWGGIRNKLGDLGKKIKGIFIRNKQKRKTKKDKTKDINVIEVDAKPVNNENRDNTKSNTNNIDYDMKLMEKFFKIGMNLTSIHDVLINYYKMLKESVKNTNNNDEYNSNHNNDAISRAKASVDELEKLLNDIPVEDRKYLGELIMSNTSMTSQFVAQCSTMTKLIDILIKDIDKLLKSNVSINDKTKNIITSNTKEISQIISRYYKCMADAYFKS